MHALIAISYKFCRLLLSGILMTYPKDNILNRYLPDLLPDECFYDTLKKSEQENITKTVLHFYLRNGTVTEDQHQNLCDVSKL